MKNYSYIRKMPNTDGNTVDLTSETAISKEILKVLKSFRTELRGEIQEFRTELRGEVQEFKIQNEKIIKKTAALEKNIKIVDEKYKHLSEEVEALQSKVNYLQQKEFINDLLITGLPVNKTKPLIDTVTEYIKILDKDFVGHQIDFVYRFNRSHQPNTNTIAPVIVRFKENIVKRKILQLQKGVGPVLQNQIICDGSSSSTAKVISQQRLTPSNYKLLQRARQFKQEFGYKFVWITDSYNIFLQKEEKSDSIKITSLSQLQQLHPIPTGSSSK